MPPTPALLELLGQKGSLAPQSILQYGLFTGPTRHIRTLSHQHRSAPPIVSVVVFGPAARAPCAARASCTVVLQSVPVLSLTLVLVTQPDGHANHDWVATGRIGQLRPAAVHLPPRDNQATARNGDHTFTCSDRQQSYRRREHPSRQRLHHGQATDVDDEHSKGTSRAAAGPGNERVVDTTVATGALSSPRLTCLGLGVR